MNKQILIDTAKSIIKSRLNQNTFQCDGVLCENCPANGINFGDNKSCADDKRFKTSWLIDWVKANDTDVFISRELLDEVIEYVEDSFRMNYKEWLIFGDKLVKLRGEK